MIALADYSLALTVKCNETQEVVTISLPVLKNTPRDFRVKAFAEALTQLFDQLDPPVQDSQ